MGAEVEGSEQLARTSRTAGQLLADLTEPGDTAADILAEDIRDEAPVLTGELVKSVEARVVDGHGEVVIGAPHAAVVALRNPFISRGLRRALEDIADVFTTHAETALDTIEGA